MTVTVTARRGSFPLSIRRPLGCANKGFKPLAESCWIYTSAGRLVLLCWQRGEKPASTSAGGPSGSLAARN